MPSPSSIPPVEILLVEDSPDDAELMAAALHEGGLRVRVTVLDDGEEALDYLRRQGRHREAPRPDIVLLDLRLPRLSGEELLDFMKHDAELVRVPVVVMTADDRAIPAAYDLMANCCVAKPVGAEQFASAVKKIEAFWLMVASRVRRSG